MKQWIGRLLLLSVALLTLGSCAPKGCAIRVGDRRISETAYQRTVADLRQTLLSTAQEEESEEFWTAPGADGKSRSQAGAEAAQEALIRDALYSLEFDRLGLSFTAQEEAVITEAVQQTVAAYGSMSAFQQSLAESGYTYEEFLEEYKTAAKKNKVLSHHFADVSEADLLDYYRANYVYVKFIYISKEDPQTGQFLVGDALAQAKAKAQSALEAANRAGELDNFDDLIGLYADAEPEESKGTLVSDNGQLDKEFTKGALALEVGQVKLIETEGAFMVTKRLDGESREIYTASLRRQLLQEMKSKEIADLLLQWEQDFGVKRYSRVLKKYLPEKIAGF